MALAKLQIDSNLFGVPPPPSFDQIAQPSGDVNATRNFGDVAPLGGTPTVPATAQPVAPSQLYQPQPSPIAYIPPGSTAEQVPGSMPWDYVDPSRYDPNLTWDDYYNNYHAPDRTSVLAQYPTGEGMIHPTGPEWPWSPSNPGGYGGQNAMQSVGAPVIDPNAPPQPPATPTPTTDISSILMTPPPYSPSSPYWNNTGINGGRTLPTPPTTPTAAGAPGSTGGQQPYWTMDYFASTFGRPSTPQELLALEPQIVAAGGKVLRNAAGVAGKILTPDGRTIDIINSAGAGGNGFQWLEGGGGSGGDGGMGGTGSPLSGSIDSALLQLLSGGSTPFGHQMENLLLSILSGNGQTPDLTNQLQSARTDAGRAMNAQMADVDAALAARGLASTPGVAQGPHIGATERIAENVGADFASTLRDIESHGLDLAHATELQALSLATGLSESQAQNILNAVGLGTNRQSALANIALQQLGMNQDWNKFILGYGLDQQKLAEDISQGRIQNVIQLLQLFLQGAGTAAGGHY